MTPATDQKIAQRYTAANLEKKNVNKTAFQEELGWAAEPKRAVICIPAGMSEALGGALFEEVIEGLLSLDVELLILGKGSSDYGALCTDIAKNHSHRVAIVPNDEISIRKMYAAADIALFLADPASQDEVTTALSFGVVPVSPTTKVLTDYNPIQEAGNAFIFTKNDKWHCFGALIRAIETYKFPFDWRTIQKHCMKK